MNAIWAAPSLDDVAEYAHTVASQRAPGCFLVRVFAAGMNRQGRCQLEGVKDDYITRWEFAFYVASEHRWLTVSWLPIGYGGLDIPYVDENAGNCSNTHALDCQVFALPSSGHIAQRFLEYSDTGLSGAQRDVLVVTHEAPEGDVLFVSNGQTTWRTLLSAIDLPFEE